MKRLRDIIVEAWKVDSYDHKNGTGRKVFADHHAHINGHDVHIGFSGNADKHFNINYSVNGSFEKHGLDRATGIKIGKHVTKRIDSFVRHMKPKSIGMKANTEQKLSKYAAFAKILARKHGGKHDSDEKAWRHSVRWDNK